MAYSFYVRKVKYNSDESNVDTLRKRLPTEEGIKEGGESNNSRKL